MKTSNNTRLLQSASRATLSRILATAMSTKGRIILDEDTRITRSPSRRLVVTDADGDTQTFPASGKVAAKFVRVSKATLVRIITTVLSPRGKVFIDEETQIKITPKRITLIDSDGDRQCFAV